MSLDSKAKEKNVKNLHVGYLGVWMALVVGMLVADASPVFAQRDSGAKARGEFGTGFWSNQRASRNIQHARDYSRSFYQYSRDAHPVQPSVAKSEATELGRNIEAAKKELATVGKEYATDKEVLARLAVIEEHLAKSAAEHKTLHACCQKDAVDEAVSMECCNNITKELEKALAEHDALMRSLELKSRTEEKKPE